VIKMHGEREGMHRHGRYGHMHGGMEKDWMMNQKYFEKLMEYLSEEDKKKLLAAKISMKIDFYEKRKEILDEKKKIMEMKFDMKKAKMEKKIDFLEMMHDMVKDKI